MRHPFTFTLLISTILCAVTGCTAFPDSRARERPAALQSLSPEDRKLALNGNIRQGFGVDAVYVAWGAPAHTFIVHAGRQPLTYWLYTHMEYAASGGYFGVSRGFNYHGRHIDPAPEMPGFNDFYVAPPSSRGLPRPETEVPYKKVVFENGRVIDFEPVRDQPGTSGNGSSGF